MATWIECRDASDAPIWVNVDEARAMQRFPAQGSTVITFSETHRLVVKEEPRVLARRQAPQRAAGEIARFRACGGRATLSVVIGAGEGI
jgi:hypothetical protein